MTTAVRRPRSPSRLRILLTEAGSRRRARFAARRSFPARGASAAGGPGRRRACCRGRSRRAGHPPATSSRRRSVSPRPRRPAPRAGGTRLASAEQCARRSWPRGPPGRAAGRPRPSTPSRRARRSSACSRATSSSNVERLGQVVVASGAEAREPVGHGVPGGQEQHRGGDAPRAQGLADVAPVGVGQADVDDQERPGTPARRRPARRLRGHASGPRSPPRRARAGGDRRSSASSSTTSTRGAGIASVCLRRGALLNAREGSRRAAGGPAGGVPAGWRRASTTAAAPPSPARKPQGIASWSGGGSKTCVSIATSICASSQPSPAASSSAAPSTSAASLHTNAPMSPQRRADRGHRRELVAALGDRERDEQRHRRRGEHDRERLLDVADPGQVDGRDRADGLRGLLVDVLDLRRRRPLVAAATRVGDGRRGLAARLREHDVRAAGVVDALAGSSRFATMNESRGADGNSCTVPTTWNGTTRNLPVRVVEHAQPAAGRRLAASSR